MEVRPGYKQTDLGVIPQDWDAVPLAELGQFKNGINKGSEAFGHGSPFVNLMDVFGVSKISSSEELGLVATNAVEQKTYDLKQGDVIFIRSSVKPSGVGLTAVLEINLLNTVFSGFLIRFRDAGVLDTGFKRYCFSSTYFRNKLIGASSVSANTNINQDSLKRLLLAVPPSASEQCAIAAALSDVDALLAGLDRLIAKKRDLKQAAMQQLLTGQTRLPGFQGEWEVKRLGEVAEMGSGGTPLSSVSAFYGGGIPWVSIADMTRTGRVLETTEKTLTLRGLESSAAQLFPAGTVLYAMYASLGECCIAGVPVTTSQAILGIRPRHQLVGDLLYYFLISLKAKVRTLGQHGTQANLNKGIVQDFQIPLPSREEQTAIAAVLSDMDAELTALEARRAKTRALKQAMMQELLTGRTRLL